MRSVESLVAHRATCSPRVARERVRSVSRTQPIARRASRSSSVASGSIDVLSTTLIVDDLVFADGETKMGVLGGGGPQTLFGAVLHPRTPSLGLVAGVGENDCPKECLQWLTERGVDISGLIPTVGMPTPRAWQITEYDGRRTQVWRLDASDALYSMLRPRFDLWPEQAQRATAIHFGVNPMRPDVELVRALRDAGCSMISIEPFTHATRPLTDNDLGVLCSLGDVFSPNEYEARSFWSNGHSLSVGELIKRMVDNGAKVVCLRRGSKGAIVYDARTKEGYECAPLSANVVDETGCGNAFCGGFIAELSGNGGTVRDALAWGTVAASIMLEYVGVPMDPIANHRAEAQKRFAKARQSVKPFDV